MPADADLILGNGLLDIKTTKKGKPNRSQYWQIVGYALADYTNEFGIERVGFYYARYGALVTWALPDLLRRLAGEPGDIGQLRADFKHLLGTLAVERPRFFTVVGPPTPRTKYVPVGRVVQRAVKFLPPASGSGKWHAPYSEVPGQSRPDDLKLPGRTPACGSKVMLVARSETITPAVGSKYADADCHPDLPTVPGVRLGLVRRTVVGTIPNHRRLKVVLPSSQERITQVAHHQG